MSDNSKPTQNAVLSFEQWLDRTQAVAALRAVADLHQPRNKVTRSASGHLVDTPGPCTDCDWDWPCPTIQAATSAIGVQVWSQKTG